MPLRGGQGVHCIQPPTEEHFKLKPTACCALQYAPLIGNRLQATLWARFVVKGSSAKGICLKNQSWALAADCANKSHTHSPGIIDYAMQPHSSDVTLAVVG